MKHKIAYIDEDDAAINTFYQTFKNDFEVFRIKVDAASSIEDIIKLVFENEVDVVITDFLLEENASVSFNGNNVVEAIRGYKPHFPVIMLTSFEPEAINHMEDVHIVYGKNILDGESVNELKIFTSKIKSSVENYHAKIVSTKSEIESLIKKRNDEGIDVLEEERLTKLFILLDELEPEGKGVPINFIQKDQITRLNEFVLKTREVLEELKKKKQK